MYKRQAIATLLNKAGIDELLDEVSGGIAFLTVGLKHLHLHLHGIVVGNLSLRLLPLKELGLFLLFDLLLSSSALASCLEHIGRGTLASYI